MLQWINYECLVYHYTMIYNITQNTTKYITLHTSASSLAAPRPCIVATTTAAYQHSDKQSSKLTATQPALLKQTHHLITTNDFSYHIIYWLTQMCNNLFSICYSMLLKKNKHTHSKIAQIHIINNASSSQSVLQYIQMH